MTRFPGRKSSSPAALKWIGSRAATAVTVRRPAARPAPPLHLDGRMLAAPPGGGGLPAPADPAAQAAPRPPRPSSRCVQRAEG
eukprot:gene22960-biopygen23780